MSQSSNPLKQRLVGAVVLVALGVIFIPMLLEQEGEEGVPLYGTNIPEKPKEISGLRNGNEVNLIEPTQPPAQTVTPVDRHTSPAAASDKHAALPTDKTVAPESAPETTKRNANGESSVTKPEPHGWAVQLGSFSQKKNALRLRDKLRARGYNAFIQAVTTANGRVFRVRVGPEASKEKAEELRRALQKALKLNGVVLKHP